MPEASDLKMTKISIDVPTDMAVEYSQRVKELNQKQPREWSRNKLVRRAMREFLERHPKSKT